MPPVQHNIEDKVFKNLIKKYFRRRDFAMVEALFNDYGRILEDRNRDFERALGEVSHA